MLWSEPRFFFFFFSGVFFFYLWVNLWAKSNLSTAHLHSSLIKCEVVETDNFIRVFSNVLESLLWIWNDWTGRTSLGLEGNSGFNRQLIVNSFSATLGIFIAPPLHDCSIYFHWHLAKKKKQEGTMKQLFVHVDSDTTILLTCLFVEGRIAGLHLVQGTADFSRSQAGELCLMTEGQTILPLHWRH